MFQENNLLAVKVAKTSVSVAVSFCTSFISRLISGIISCSFFYGQFAGN